MMAPEEQNREKSYSQKGTWVATEGEVSAKSHLDKAQGRMVYSSDLTVPGMLTGKALRSPYPHCLVNWIDTQKALEIPGVEAVLTAEDIPGENIIGKEVEDQEFLVSKRARSVMDALAIVAAETEEIADAALAAIDIDLTPLPAVFDPEEALSSDAPQLYEDGNLLMDFHIKNGNSEVGMSEADIVIENTYRFPWVEHAFLETQAVVAAPDEDDVITVWLGCHNIYGERDILSRAFDWPKERFRVVLVPAGGSFGGKDDNIIPTWAALLAHRAKRPVRFDFGRKESMRGHSKRHSQIIHHKLGLQGNGRLIAAEVDILSDTGAYAHWGRGITKFASLQSTGPYQIPHADVHAKLVYTNNIMAGAMRCWGTPGVEFAMETQMDIAARKLKIHPLKLRWMNALQDGDETITGAEVPSGCYMRETVELAAQSIGLELRKEEI